MKKRSALLTVRVAVTVVVDTNDGELRDRMHHAGKLLSVEQVVCAEVESNLESVSYVRQVLVKPNGKEVPKC